MAGSGEAVEDSQYRMGGVRCGSAVLVRIVRVRRGTVRFGVAVVAGLVGATSGVTWRLRSGVVWFIPVRLDMAVLIRHEQVRQGGVR